MKDYDDFKGEFNYNKFFVDEIESDKRRFQE